MQEVIFSRKNRKLTDVYVFFNNVPVTCTSSQKHLEMYIDETLNLNNHIKEKVAKPMKGICVLKKLSDIVFQSSFLIIYIAFVKPHLEYGDITYGQPKNECSSQNYETIQYHVVIAITGAITENVTVKAVL